MLACRPPALSPNDSLAFFALIACVDHQEGMTMRGVLIAALVLVGCSPAKPTAQAENQAPPCVDGKPTCDPWERDWKDGKGPPPGSIVRADGTIEPGDPNKFDLECDVSYRLTLNGKEEKSGLVPNTTRVYAFDLSIKQWCDAFNCKPANLDTVSPSAITFHDEKGTQFRIDRITGDVVGTFGDMQMGSKTTGTCTKASFTPFPKAKF
jgi:hypothetical protein